MPPVRSRVVQETTRAALVNAFCTHAVALPPDQLASIVPLVASTVGAESARLLIADYAQRTMCPLGHVGSDGVAIDGSVAGRAFVSGQLVVVESDGGGTTAAVALADGVERLGVVEMEFGPGAWSEHTAEVIADVVRVLVLVLVSKRRYTDALARSRRARSLSIAAEIQWDLLPPLACATATATIAGTLEPAYETGGDSFDYAANDDRIDFVLLDAVGHGMAAVLIAITAVNSFRNVRREGGGLVDAYESIGHSLAERFGHSYFATGVLGSLDAAGELTWINAGHPLPLLVRDGTLVGELECAPSLPMGLGGTVIDLRQVALQPKDRVLVYTDGVVERRGGQGIPFGVDRLGDMMVRATLDGVSTAETARRLSRTVVESGDAELRDDATMVIVDHHGHR